MTLIIMAEDLFRDKALNDKWEVVKDHFERAYHITFKRRLKDEEINHLYKQLKLLKDTQFFYEQKC